MADAGALQAAQEDPARTSQLLAEAKASDATDAQPKSAPRVSAASRPLSAGRGARPSRPSGSAAPATPPAPAKPATPVAKPATPPPAVLPPAPPSPTPQPVATPPVAAHAAAPPAGGARKPPTVRYADLEAAETGAAPAPPQPFAPRQPPVASPTRTDSVMSDYALPLRVAPDWARNGGGSSGPGRSVSQLSAAPAQPAGSKRADLEAAIAANNDEEESYEVIDRASCCWQCTRLTVFLVLLSINNVVVCICAAYLSRSVWFDSWFNDTGLRALSKALAVTVPRCSAAELLAVRLARANVTNATMLAANTTLATGSLLADGMGRVCGVF